MDWLEFPWVLVSLWVITLFLDILYNTGLGPKTVRRALRVVFGKWEPHALYYALLVFLSYFWNIQTILLGSLLEVWGVLPDPVFLVVFAVSSPLLLVLDYSTVTYYAAVGTSIVYAIIAGAFAAIDTDEVDAWQRRSQLGKEIFGSDNAEEFLDELIARAYTDPANPQMKRTLSDLQFMARVGDTKGATIGKAFERYKKRKNAPGQNDSKVDSLCQAA